MELQKSATDPQCFAYKGHPHARATTEEEAERIVEYVIAIRDLLNLVSSNPAQEDVVIHEGHALF